MPLSEGTFDLDDYIDYLIEFELIGEERGERPHVLAVCQPAVPAYAATALMNAAEPMAAQDPDDDGRADRHPPGPDRGEHTATERPLGWFEKNAVATVPIFYPGAGRKVYRVSFSSPAS